MMDIGAFLLISALLILSLFFVARPFFDGPMKLKAPADQGLGSQMLSQLNAERSRLLSELKELDLDHLNGKIPESDFIEQRRSLVQHGALLLKQIDEIQLSIGRLPNSVVDGKLPATAGNHSVGFRLNGDQSNRSSNGVVVISNSEDELEVMIANRRRSRISKADGFCPNCGAPHQVADRFCPRCGERISQIV